MSSRNLFASILMACLLAVGFLGIAPVANDASAGKSMQNAAKAPEILRLRCNVVAAAYAFPCLWARATSTTTTPTTTAAGITRRI